MKTDYTTIAMIAVIIVGIVIIIYYLVKSDCSTNSDCKSPQTCVSGKCVSGGCSTNGDCGAGLTCVGSKCTPLTGCGSGPACTPPQVCITNTCMLTPSKKCDSNANPCLSGQICSSAGYCGSMVSGVPFMSTFSPSISSLPAGNTITSDDGSTAMSYVTTSTMLNVQLVGPGGTWDSPSDSSGDAGAFLWLEDTGGLTSWAETGITTAVAPPQTTPNPPYTLNVIKDTMLISDSTGQIAWAQADNTG